MATFQKADRDVYEILRGVIDDYHPDLVEAEVKVGIVMAYPDTGEDGKPKGPAIKERGRAVLGKIKTNNEADRVDGKPDATLTLAADEWDKLGDLADAEERRAATVDHFIQALAVKREASSNRIKTDPQGRPLLEIRHPDWEIKGYRAVAERHGAKSLEVTEAREFRNRYSAVLFLDFGDDQPALPGLAEKKPRKPRGGAVAAASRR